MLISSVSSVSIAPPQARLARELVVAPSEEPSVETAKPAAEPLNGVAGSLMDPAIQMAAQESGQPRRSDVADVADVSDLSEEEQAQVQALRRRDAEVRRHERAHTGAGGAIAGQPIYEYVRGPDGRQYAVGGEVAIDAGPAGTPEATIQKMETVIRAALAPADPSTQDVRVAAQARQVKAEAIAEKNAEEREEIENSDKPRFFDIVV